MLQITIRSVDQTEADAVDGAKRLVAALNGPEDAFLEAAWGLAKVLAPVGSDPFGYFLNPAAGQKYLGTELLAKFWELRSGLCMTSPEAVIAWKVIAIMLPDFPPVRLPWDVTEPAPAPEHVRPGEEMVASLKRKIAGAMREAVGPVGTISDPMRGWLCSLLCGLEYPSSHPLVPCPEAWVKLCAYAAFHMRALRPFTTGLLRQECTVALPLFWQGFLRWHGGERDADTTRMLEKVLTSHAASPEERKVALLLLCTESTSAPDKLPLLIESHGDLLRSPLMAEPQPLPVLYFAVPSHREPGEVLRDLVAAVARWVKSPRSDGARNEIAVKATELSGACAELPSVREVMWSLTNSKMRALVWGACEEERQNIASLLAALTARTTKFWKSWSPNDADIRSERLAREVCRWKERPTGHGGPFLRRHLRDRTLIAAELQWWGRRSLNAMKDLLEVISCRSSEDWFLAVIGTRDGYHRGVCPLSDVLASPETVMVKIPALRERPKDIPNYIASISKEMISRNKALTNVGWGKDACQALEKWCGLTSVTVLREVMMFVSKRACGQSNVTTALVEQGIQEWMETIGRPAGARPLDVDVSENGLSILRYLSREGALRTASAICEAVSIAGQATRTKELGNLERQGLVIRPQGERSGYRLTPRGRSYLDSVPNAYDGRAHQGDESPVNGRR